MMKTFIVIPAAYGATYKFKAAKINSVGAQTIQLVDDKGNVVAIVPLQNAAAVFAED